MSKLKVVLQPKFRSSTGDTRPLEMEVIDHPIEGSPFHRIYLIDLGSGSTICNYVNNGGYLTTTDWINPSNGIAQFWTDTPCSATNALFTAEVITDGTPYGFDGRMQFLIGANTGATFASFGIMSNDFGIYDALGKTYNMSCKYKSSNPEDFQNSNTGCGLFVYQITSRNGSITEDLISFIPPYDQIGPANIFQQNWVSTSNNFLGLHFCFSGTWDSATGEGDFAFIELDEVYVCEVDGGPNTGFTFGYIYNGYAIRDAHDLAPTGWRIPTKTEFQALRDHIDAGATGWGWSDNDAGGPLKSTVGWFSPNAGATNAYLFDAMGGGARDSFGNYGGFSSNYSLWSSTTTAINGFGVALVNAQIGLLGMDTWSIGNGMYVRCIQDKDGGENDGDTGTMQDYDSNTYDWVVIGDYRWMRNGLKTTHYADGTAIPLVSDASAWDVLTTGARCAYDNNPDYV